MKRSTATTSSRGSSASRLRLLCVSVRSFSGAATRTTRTSRSASAFRSARRSMMADKTDGTFQEMSVHDKDNAALPPTVEGQDMSTLDRVIVPMPQFVDPHDARAQSGSINMDLDDHPMDHSEDYGAAAGEGAQIDSPENVGLRTSVGDEKP